MELGGSFGSTIPVAPYSSPGSYIILFINILEKQQGFGSYFSVVSWYYLNC